MAKDKKSTLGSDLDSYTRRKIDEIDEPRYVEYRRKLESSERPPGSTPRLEPRSLKDDAKVMGYGVMNAYGVGPATALSGGINAANAANKARKKVGSRAKEGAIKAAEAVVKADTALKSAKSKVKSVGASSLKAVKSAAKQFLEKDLSANKPVRTKDAKSAASKDTVKKAYGGAIKKMARGGSVSKRADGCAIRGKTKGRIT